MEHLVDAVRFLAVGPLHATTAPAFLSELQDQDWALRRDRDSGDGHGRRGMPSRFPVAEAVAVSWYYRRTAPVERDAARKCRKEGYPANIGSYERGTAHRRPDAAGADGERTSWIEGCREESLGVWLDEVAIEGGDGARRRRG